MPEEHGGYKITYPEIELLVSSQGEAELMCEVPNVVFWLRKRSLRLSGSVSYPVAYNKLFCFLFKLGRFYGWLPGDLTNTGVMYSCIMSPLF